MPLYYYNARILDIFYHVTNGTPHLMSQAEMRPHLVKGWTAHLFL